MNFWKGMEDMCHVISQAIQKTPYPDFVKYFYLFFFVSFFSLLGSLFEFPSASLSICSLFCLWVIWQSRTHLLAMLDPHNFFLFSLQFNVLWRDQFGRLVIDIKKIQIDFFLKFAQHVRVLHNISVKELNQQSLDAHESQFLKTITEGVGFMSGIPMVLFFSFRYFFVWFSGGEDTDLLRYLVPSVSSIASIFLIFYFYIYLLYIYFMSSSPSFCFLLISI